MSLALSYDARAKSSLPLSVCCDVMRCDAMRCLNSPLISQPTRSIIGCLPGSFNGSTKHASKHTRCAQEESDDVRMNAWMEGHWHFSRFADAMWWCTFAVL